MSADTTTELRANRRARPTSRRQPRRDVALNPDLDQTLKTHPMANGARASQDDPPARRRTRGQQGLASYRNRLILADAVGAGLAVLVAALTSDISFGRALEVVILGPLVWVGTLSITAAYEGRFLGVSPEEFRAVGRACVAMLAAVAVVLVATQLNVDRAFALICALGMFGSTASARILGRSWLVRQRRAGRMMQQALVVGRGDSAAALVRSLKGEPQQGLNPVAVCAYDGGDDLDNRIEGLPVEGTPVEAVEVVDRLHPDVVVVAAHPDLAGVALRRLSWALAERDVQLIVAPGLLDVAGPRMSIRPSNYLSLLHIERPVASRIKSRVKSVGDRVIALVMLCLLAPVLLACALAIRFESGGPVVFLQRRVGEGGKDFTMLKFRTMRLDTEREVATLLDYSDGNGVLFKMKNDPRVTRVGAIMRKYSLDELPQLINVLRGEMSLVGPRPPLRSEVDQYEPDAHRRLKVRPGITGLWQVSGRSHLSWEDTVRLDLQYVDNWTPLLDVTILIRTVRAVTTGDGAY